MRKWILALSLAAVAALALPNDENQLVMIAKMAEKKAVVLASMGLQGEKREAFGKLYDEYQLKMASVLGEKLGIMMRYIKAQKDLDAQTAQKLLKEWFDVNAAALRLQEAYARKFGKFLSPAEVVRYLQIENRFRIMQEAELAELVPVAEVGKKGK
ncbi:MAG: hypothetical protein GXO33_07315 [Epsilonproteobacteria bacterium]|nr:hypothetical protein [Campylobacterota bacterium]